MPKADDRQNLQTAFSLHQAGKLDKAADLYRQVIKRDPHNSQALHYLGVVEASVGNLEQAKTLMARSLKIQPANIQFVENYATILFQAGDYKTALQISQQGLQSNNNNVSLLYVGALALFRLQRLEDSIAQLDKLLLLAPNHIAAINDRGSVLAEMKKYDAALASFQKALAFQPRYAEAHLNSGNLYGKLKRHDEAFAAYDKALALKPDLADAWLGRGNILLGLKRHDDAFGAFDKALALKPDLAGAWLGRGNVSYDLKRCEEALAAYDKALAFNPDLTDAWLGRSAALHKLKRHDEALAAYDKALALKPDSADAWLGRGIVFCDLKRHDEAFAAYDKALALKSDFAEAWLGRGNVSYELKRYDDAFAAYDQALKLKPDLAEAWFDRGNVCCELNLNDKAVADFQRALAIKPDFAEARFAACFAELPILYTSEEEIASRRGAYEEKLRALCGDVEAGRVPGDLVKAIEFKQPFYLAYQGRNDRDLQQLYGSMVCRVMERTYPGAQATLPPMPGEPVRVGIVSSFFYQHSNWKIPIKGWLSQLNRNRFKIFGYHIGTERDTQTDAAAAMCDRFVERVSTVEGWRREILADEPHVLIYPGLLMDKISVQLAAQRLAPVQCNSWGHPETSGMPTLDYFLSSDLMEPPQAAEHYTEQLVRLPNLSSYYEPTETEPSAMDRAELGLRPDATVFWCGQSLFKYLPQFDRVFAGIAKLVKNSQFVFLQHQGREKISSLFQERLDRIFAASDLDASDHCLLLPPLSHGQYVAALGMCDVFLDSVGWSGCNSTLESLTHDLPIVTMSGALMRGRHSAAILRMMGITETITDTVDDYISTAARLANHPEERHALRRKIADNKHRLYRDRACISALEDFLDRAARQRAI